MQTTRYKDKIHNTDTQTTHARIVIRNAHQRLRSDFRDSVARSTNRTRPTIFFKPATQTFCMNHWPALARASEFYETWCNLQTDYTRARGILYQCIFTRATAHAH